MNQEKINKIKESKHFKIKSNKILCLKCNDLIESKHRHDFKYCSCENIFVDGGKDYLRRGGTLTDYNDLSEYYKCNDSFINCDGSVVYVCFSYKDTSNNDWYCNKCLKKQEWLNITKFKAC